MVEEYEKRRERFINKLPENSIALVFSGNEIRCSADEAYKFQFDYNFYYLTGIKQENSILLIKKNYVEQKVCLFIQKYDELKEKWTGIRLKSQEARKISGIENIYFVEDFEDIFAKFYEEYALNGQVKLLLDTESAVNLGEFGQFVSIDNFKTQKLIKYPSLKVLDSSEILKRLRMVKSDFEISQIKKAIHNTNLGLQKILKQLKPKQYEYEMANLFEYEIRKENNATLAFNTIAASGKNALILHYPCPMSKMNEKELVLFDLGADYEGYKADISRTYPISGKFSEEQKEIYDIVLSTNKLIINSIKPNVTIRELQEKARIFMAQQLIKIGILTNVDDISKYYYHNISHHLGLDTHDISLREEPLQKGNVITVEPGLYIKELGIGIRIEDDVLVTENGSECLSNEIIKEVREIEKFMAK